jgi:cytochrome P450
MFDERRVRNPEAFDPDRPAAEYMLFGHGLHWCIGAYIAYAQITQTFKPLLRRSGLRRAAGSAGEMHRLTLFPVHLTVEFES